VHEAYIRLVAVEQAQNWDSRGHFFAAAAEAMRRILVDNARRKASSKHGGDLRRVDLLDSEAAVAPSSNEQILLLDEALNRLAAVRPKAAELIKLRFFSGLTVDEAAPILDLSPRSARRLWVFARAWLRRDMELAGGPVA
jgi:RNA polymerase sigma factor (TIGR02999 family)